MKILIIAVNIALALLLTGTVTSAFRKDAPHQSHAGRTRRSAKPAKNDDAGKNADNDTAPAPLTREEKFNAILNADIFNPERTPNAAFGRRGNRMELSLVGTFEAGKIRGAVILCRTNSRQINPFMRMMWGGGPGGGMPGMPDMPSGGRGGVRRFMMPSGMMNGQRRNNGNNNDAVKQYVRLGETMPNGYTLTALTRTRATLTRGGDKMELELQMPSQNQNAARRTGPARLNVNQQLQQAQLQTQQMMVRALMDMRGGGGGNRGGNRGGGNRGGRR